MVPARRPIFGARVLLTALLCFLVGVPAELVLAHSAGAPPAQAQQDEYVVKQGDTLSAIAQSHNTTVDELVRINSLASRSSLSLGQVLKLSSTQPAVAPPAEPAPEAKPEAQSPAPANVTASSEAAVSIPAAQPATAPPSVITSSLGRESAPVGLPANANPAAGASSSSGASLPLGANSSPSATPAPSGFPLPSVPELLAILLLVTLGGWVIFEMRRARRRVPNRGPGDSGPNS